MKMKEFLIPRDGQFICDNDVKWAGFKYYRLDPFNEVSSCLHNFIRARHVQASDPTHNNSIHFQNSVIII